MRFLRDADVAGKRVIIRVDYNVPLDNGAVSDDFKIRASLKTINYCRENGARQIILMSHLGRPKGTLSEEYSLSPVARCLSALLGEPVALTKDAIVQELPEASIVILENLRFHPEEEANDSRFAKQLAGYADLFVNDAFAVCHRAHASVHAITKFLDSYAGLLVEEEVSSLARVTQNPNRPYIAIIGGKKEDKIRVIRGLLLKVDLLIIGGVLANTFLKAKGYNLGESKFTPELLDTARQLMDKAGDKIMLPVDLVFADKFMTGARTMQAGIESTEIAGFMGVDIGANTIKNYKTALAQAKTIFWAGPIGAFEHFPDGTKEIAEFIAGLDAVKVVGGGDSAAAVISMGFRDKMTHVSTGGGAGLEYVEGKLLPGLAVLE